MSATWPRAVQTVGLVLLTFALAHSFEDFSYGVPHDRFGIDTSPAALLLAVGFIAQVLILAAARSGHPLAYLANAGVGLTWFLAAALDHLGEVLGSEAYRAGVFSKAVEVGIMASGIALLVLSGSAMYRAIRSKAG